MRPLIRPKMIVSAVLAALVLAGCASTPEPPPAPESTSAVEQWAALEATELIDQLEALPLDERPRDVLASVRQDEVVVSAADGSREVSVPIQDGHYLSIAPYLDRTHDCFFHSLTTCTGEMGNEELTVRIVDDRTGEVYVDETARANDNGFIGFWLPRDVAATVTVTGVGGTAEASVQTGAEDLTCLTSLQLT
ncbi:CueP family metal-binding protein [Cellulomonas sp. Y8]|jgi:outer membrane murein-binding lipoprotein Lpp|uniref:CueP family metal-binding protein n=1 Tax=Cellulomonas sp. Y8 TaxID=2591145 RepID=UPI003D7300D9